MPKPIKRMLSLLLAVVLLCGGLPLALPVGAEDTVYKQGDVIEFGSYPQSQVTENDLILRLNLEQAAWHAYPYHYGVPMEDENGKTYYMPVQSDYMQYKDVQLDNVWYRGVRLSAYRPLTTNGLWNSGNNTYLSLGETYWFRYEPLRWRVLNPYTGLVLSENVIDGQPFSIESYTHNERRYTKGSADYTQSYIRSWLNNTFYATAFSNEEQSMIQTQTLNNFARYKGYDYITERNESDYGACDDNVFLLSYYDATNSAYGFDGNNYSDPLKKLTLTAYASAQGCSRSYAWLRTASLYGHSNSYCFDNYNGYRVDVESQSKNINGIRPALVLDFAAFQEYTGNVDATDVQTKTGKVSVSFRSAWLAGDSMTYRHELAQLCAKYAMLGYAGEAKLTHALQALGLQNIKMNLDTGSAEVNYFIANKKIKIAGEAYTFVFAGCIGSHKLQWFTDFQPGLSETHLGFQNARDYIMIRHLENYLSSLGESASRIKLVLTGHSRGAAVANLIAAQLISERDAVTPENIYTYTFATPNVTKDAHRTDEQYKRIFNIVNPEDFVTKTMPAAWGYGRYGITYALPSRTNSLYGYLTNNMAKNFQTYTGGKRFTGFNGEQATYKAVYDLTLAIWDVNMFYKKQLPVTTEKEFTLSPYDFFQQSLCVIISKLRGADIGDEMFDNALIIVAAVLTSLHSAPCYKSILKYFIASGTALNPAFENSHSAECYCAWMDAITESELTRTKQGYHGSVNCPVDVEIYEKDTNELVGRIVNNTVDELIAAKENSVVMYVDGESKCYWLPGDGQYEVRLTGNGEGTMDHTVSLVDSDTGEEERVNFFDVPITQGKTMTGEMTGEGFVLQDYTMQADGGETLQPTEKLEETELQKISINVTAEGKGSAESVAATSGDYVTLAAVPEEHNEFLGWFENGALVCDTEEYAFVAKTERNLTAKFTDNVPCTVTVETESTQGSTVTGAGEYSVGDSVTLSANPAGKEFFDGWFVDGKRVSGDTTYTFTVEKDVTVRAVFKHPVLESVSIADRTETAKSSFTLAPDVKANGAAYTLSFASDNDKVAAVDAKTGKVTTGKRGTATITVTATDEYGNSVKDTCTVTVKYTVVQWLIIILLFGWIWY